MHIEFRGGLSGAVKLPSIEIAQHQVIGPQRLLVGAVTGADQEVLRDPSTDIAGQTNMILAAPEIVAGCDDLVFGGLDFREEFNIKNHGPIIA
jgi:hypothetical protein